MILDAALCNNLGVDFQSVKTSNTGSQEELLRGGAFFVQGGQACEGTSLAVSCQGNEALMRDA